MTKTIAVIGVLLIIVLGALYFLVFKPETTETPGVNTPIVTVTTPTLLAKASFVCNVQKTIDALSLIHI